MDKQGNLHLMWKTDQIFRKYCSCQNAMQKRGNY